MNPSEKNQFNTKILIADYCSKTEKKKNKNI